MQCTSQESFQQMIPIKLGDGISQTSIGRLNFRNLAVIFKTFNAEIAEIMPSDPSNIPASTTVSYSKKRSTINKSIHMLHFCQHVKWEM